MLTKLQKNALDFIAEFESISGTSPSYTDIAKALGIASKSGVFHLLRRLEERGFIRRMKYRARAIEIIKRPSAVTWSSTCPTCGQEIESHDP